MKRESKITILIILVFFIILSIFYYVGYKEEKKKQNRSEKFSELSKVQNKKLEERDEVKRIVKDIKEEDLKKFYVNFYGSLKLFDKENKEMIIVTQGVNSENIRIRCNDLTKYRIFDNKIKKGRYVLEDRFWSEIKNGLKISVKVNYFYNKNNQVYEPDEITLYVE